MDLDRKYCQGCGRTLLEIGRWEQMTEAQRAEVMASLPARLPWRKRAVFVAGSPILSRRLVSARTSVVISRYCLIAPNSIHLRQTACELTSWPSRCASPTTAKARS